jgi:phosphatidylglycerophosphate synthase
VRAGATRVLIPARFRTTLEPALIGAPRVANAVAWIDESTVPPATLAVLVPIAAILRVGAVAAMLKAPPLSVHDGARDAGVPMVTVPEPIVSELWPALTAGAPCFDAIDKMVRDPDVMTVREPSLVHAVTDAASAGLGERRLYATMGSAIDTALDVRVHRRVSRLVSRTSIRFGITPNTITIASLIVGLAAAWMFWNATPLAAAAGLALYALAVVIDHADGEVARLTLNESAIGEWLDIVVDTIIHAAVVLAMGATSATLTGHGATLGVLAAIGVAVSAAVAKAWPSVAMPDRVGAALSQLGTRDGYYAMLVLFIVLRAAWPGGLPWLMIVVAGGSHAYWVSRGLYRAVRGV